MKTRLCVAATPLTKAIQQTRDRQPLDCRNYRTLFGGRLRCPRCHTELRIDY